jgi:hypothetical protein
MALIYSEKLTGIIAAKEDPRSEADSTCTTGYDNDGSTGFEIFENGFELGSAAGGKNVYYGTAENYAVFLVASSEDEACARAASWPDAFQQTQQASNMKPSQLASQLRRIASKIENSKSPDRSLVARDLKKVLAGINPASVTSDLSQIRGQYESDENDNPLFFVSDDGKLKWPYHKTNSYDWKDKRGQLDCLKNLSNCGEVVVLFDGSDSIILACMQDAISI